MKTTVKGLTSYQRQLIVHIIALDDYSDAERAEHLRKFNFCTDAVKFEVLKNSERVSKKQYDRLCDLYFLGKVKKQWTYAETVRLIDCYNNGISDKKMAKMFDASEAAVNCRLSYIRGKPHFKAMFTLKKYTRRTDGGKT